MADLVEIVLVVRDLASGKLDDASRRMDVNFRKIRQSATGASTSLNQMARDTERLGAASRRTSTEVDRTTRDLVQIERALHAVGGVAGDERVRLEAAAAALRNHRNEMRLMESEAGRLTTSVSRFVVSLFSWVQGSRGVSRSMTDNDRDARRLAGGLSTVERGMLALVTVGGLLPRLFGNLSQGFSNFVQGMGASAEEAKNLESGMGRLGASVSSFASSLPLVNFGLAGMLGIVVLLAEAVPLLSGTVLALTGAVTGLAAALSSLAGVAVALPAALGALGGIMAAVLTIIRPATSGILAAVQAADKAKSAAAGAGGGTTAGPVGDPVANAEKQLATTRRIDALQVKRLEDELKQARLDAIFRVRQAERDLAQAREQAFTRLIDLERRLAELRRSNDQQRAQLEQELAAAQAQQAADAARGGRHAGLTGALVGEAKADLASFNKDAVSQERDLQDQIQQQRLDGIKQIQDAEDNLLQTRIDNINHIRDLENSLKQLRIQNAQQEASAQQAVAQAGQSAGAGAAGVDAYRQALAQLDPLQRQIVQQVLDLKNRWTELTAAFRERFLQEVSRDLDAINAHLPLLARLVGGFADVITGTLGKLRALMNDPQFLGAFTRATEDATTNTGLFADAAVRLLDATVQLVDAAKPLLDFISRTADGWARWADNAARAANQSGRLADFFERVRDRLKLVLDILGNLFQGFLNIGRIAAPFGDQLLRQLDKFTQGFQDWTDSRRGKNEIRDFFRDALPAAQAVLDLVGKITGAIASIGRAFIQTEPGTGSRRAGPRGSIGPAPRTDSELTQVAKTLGQAVTPLADAITNISKAATPGLARLVLDLATFIDALSRHTEGITIAIDFLDALTRFFTFVLDHGGPIGDALGNILAPIALFAVLAPGLAVKGVTGIFKAFRALNGLGGGEGQPGLIGRVFARARTAVADGVGAVLRALRPSAVRKAAADFAEALRFRATDLKARAQIAGDAIHNFGRRLADVAKAAGGHLRDIGAKAVTLAETWGKQFLAMSKAVALWAADLTAKGFAAMRRFAAYMFATVIPAFVAWIGELVIATAAMIGLDIAMDANPIGLIVLAILAMIAVLVLVVTHWDTVSKFLLRIWGILRDTAERVWGKIRDIVVGVAEAVLHGVRRFFGAVVDFIKDHWQQILLFFAGPLGIIALVLQWTGLWDKIKSGVTEAWDWIKKHVRSAFGDIVDFFRNTAPGLLSRAFGFIWDGIESVTTTALSGIVDHIQNFVNTLIGAANWVLGHIPGVDTQIPLWHNTAPPVGAGGGGGHGAKHAQGGIAIAAAQGWVGPEAQGNIVSAVPGGLLHIVEAGHPEAVLSLDPKHKARTLEIIAEVLKRLGFRDPRPNLFGAIARARAVAADLLPDASIFTAMAAGGIGFNPVAASLSALREAARIDAENLPYVWGGGHASSPAEPSGGPPPGLDCSGFVSHILQHVNLLGGTQVASAFESYGSPGLSNLIGVLANDGHVYMEILGKYFGTSTYNPRGGPGQLPYGVRRGFVGRHPLNFPTDSKSGPDLGAIADAIAGGAAGALTTIAGHVFSSLGDVVDWIESKLPHFPHIKGLFGSLPGKAFDFARGKIVDYAKSVVPFFDQGGIVGGPPGAAVPAMVHVGEWVLNNQQLGRLATALGGIDTAHEIVFGGQVPVHAQAFGAGGIVAPTRSSGWGPQRVINQTIGPIHTTSPKIDADYVARIMEQRMLQGA